MEFTLSDYEESAQYLISRLGEVPETAVVLGSGLGAFAEGLSSSVRIPYTDIPHFSRSTAPSHAGELVAGVSGGKRILVLSGRLHYYEGLSLQQATYYLRALKLAGLKRVVLTNAAGCINAAFHPGEFMLITDHINFTGLSPCRGPNEAAFGARFFDMSGAYSKRMLTIAKDCADAIGLPVRSGVYAFMAGPQYETPAEIRALKLLGADAVGMSTVPEVIEAAHCSIETLCVSCLTNYAAGMSDGTLDSDEVIRAVAQAMPSFSAYLTAIVARL